MLNELLEKYGIPLTISPACEATETQRLFHERAGVIDCSVPWKSQNILNNLVWQYEGPNTCSMPVRYSMLQSGL